MFLFNEQNCRDDIVYYKSFDATSDVDVVMRFKQLPPSREILLRQLQQNIDGSPSWFDQWTPEILSRVDVEVGVFLVARKRFSPVVDGFILDWSGKIDWQFWGDVKYCKFLWCFSPPWRIESGHLNRSAFGTYTRMSKHKWLWKHAPGKIQDLIFGFLFEAKEKC